MKEPTFMYHSLKSALAGISLIAGISASVPAHALSLSFPVDCIYGETCFIQNYVDVDPADNKAQDYTCGSLVYDGHKGTDFRLRNLDEMEKGVNVLAAAPGVVRGIRDEMPDEGITDTNRNNVAQKECGNGIVILHEDGWETQYCHMKLKTIRVKPGEKIERGQILGQVGLSGLTEFPHLHLAIRKNGKVIDPFLGTAVATDNPPVCGASTSASLWEPGTRSTLHYIPTAILGLGFTTKIPTKEDVRKGQHQEEHIGNRAAALLFWTDVYGLQKGDKALTELLSPEGDTLASHEDVFDRNKALMFSYIGKKRRGYTWPAGTYKGRYTIIRNGEEVLRHEAELLVR